MIYNPFTVIVKLLIPVVITTTPPELSIEWNQRKLTFDDFVAKPK